MKKFIFILVLIVVSSCGKIQTINSTVIRDTIKIEVPIIVHDTIRDTVRDTVRIESNKLSFEDYNNRYILAQIRRYVELCDKRPANRKFEHGWIKRALK